MKKFKIKVTKKVISEFECTIDKAESKEKAEFLIRLRLNSTTPPAFREVSTNYEIESEELCAVQPENKISKSLAEALKKLRAIQSKYSKYGAYDSEPDAAISVAAKHALNTGKVELPSLDEWELYSTGKSETLKKICDALNAELENLLNIIVSAPVKHVSVVRQFVEGHL